MAKCLFYSDIHRQDSIDQALTLDLYSSRVDMTSADIADLQSLHKHSPDKDHRRACFHLNKQRVF